VAGVTYLQISNSGLLFFQVAEMPDLIFPVSLFHFQEKKECTSSCDLEF